MEKQQYVENARKIVELVEEMTPGQWNKIKHIIDDEFSSLTAKVVYKKPSNLELLMKQNLIS